MKIGHQNGLLKLAAVFSTTLLVSFGLCGIGRHVKLSPDALFSTQTFYGFIGVVVSGSALAVVLLIALVELFVALVSRAGEEK